MQLPLPLVKNVVLVGGGHAHALALRKWGMNPLAGVRLTVINPAPTAAYTGMLPGFVAGHYDRSELDIDLGRLARFAGARLVVGAVTAMDRVAKTVTVPGRPAIPYDVCSIDVGVSAAMPAVEGFAQHGVPARPLGRFAGAWSDFVARRKGAATAVVVIGGGVGGCELALAMNHRLRSQGASPTVTVIEAESVLSELGDRSRREMLTLLRDEGIVVIERDPVTRVEPDSIVTASGHRVTADFVAGVAGAAPHGWLADIGLDLHQGFVAVDATLRSTNDAAVFAVGDCAHMVHAPRPKAGVYAVRQAPVLFENLQATLADRPLELYEPQSDYLKLISLGEQRAAADKFGRFVQGRPMWLLKDGIDRRFMHKLDDLPAMGGPKVPANSVAGLAATIDQEPPLCGGCGAKVGADVLSGPLSRLVGASRTDVVRLPGDDAALLDMDGVRQVITTDTLRAFTSDPFRMAKIAALHAMGDCWAMGATPQAALVTVTLPQLARSLQEEWLAEVMAGAAEVITAGGADIVGGHTSMGPELSLGFTITGLLEGPAITLAGAQVGDKLVLTRPVGSGILLAGEMHGAASGNDVEALFRELETPHGQAAEILAAAGATAMTDVTGFGLAGHLFNIIRESGVAAELVLDEIPVFDGAEPLAAAGVHSHLATANRSGVPLVTGPDDPRIEVAFDPQTAGGFLASVPADRADAAVEQLRRSGFQAATVVGSIVAGDPRILVR